MKRRRLGRGLADLAAAPGHSFEWMLPEPEPLGVPPPRPVIICIGSGKGGTGKSVLTSNLATHFATGGLRVLVIDADMGLANLHLLLGLRPVRSVLDVILGRADLHEISEPGPAGIRLVAGASGNPEIADLHPRRLQRLVLAMEAAGATTDVVLVDTGAGIGRSTTSFLYAINDIVVVTTPDLTAMTDAYAVIKNVAINNAAARLYLVVNRASSAREGLEIFGRMDRISQQFVGRPLIYLGHVLEDPRLPASVAARTPILLHRPASPAAACLRGVGRALQLEFAQRLAQKSPRADGGRQA